MKYIKITAIMFGLSICLALTNTNATGSLTFVDVNIKNLSGSTKLHTADKTRYLQQSAKKINATDNLSGDGRAVKGLIDNGSWITLGDNGVLAKWTEELTYFPGESYSHYVKATKNTLSTVSYWGTWYWDVNGVEGLI